MAIAGEEKACLGRGQNEVLGAKQGLSQEQEEIGKETHIGKFSKRMRGKMRPYWEI